MKKVKEFSRSYIFLSVLYVAIGIVLLLWPSLSIEKIGKGLGIIMIVVGATYGVIYFTGNKRQEGYLQFDLVIGIIAVAFGVFILLTPEFLGMVLPFAMATVLLLGAIVKIQSAVSMKRLFIRHWYLGVIGALIIIALGIVLLVFPFKKDEQMLLYIGICLILDGTTNLLGLFCISFRTKKLEKIQRKNPGVDVKALIKAEWEKADALKAEKKARKKEKKQSEVVINDAETVEAGPMKDTDGKSGEAQAGMTSSDIVMEDESQSVADTVIQEPSGTDVAVRETANSGVAAEQQPDGHSDAYVQPDIDRAVAGQPGNAEEHKNESESEDQTK
ncbi:MAG: DUF308 domain-containing protein [Clostridiales bacterium]|nr:DUF308 domain-containing protein [Clostridiales bacterium]